MYYDKIFKAVIEVADSLYPEITNTVENAEKLSETTVFAELPERRLIHIRSAIVARI